MPLHGKENVIILNSAIGTRRWLGCHFSRCTACPWCRSNPGKEPRLDFGARCSPDLVKDNRDDRLFQNYVPSPFFQFFARIRVRGIHQNIVTFLAGLERQYLSPDSLLPGLIFMLGGLLQLIVHCNDIASSA